MIDGRIKRVGTMFVRSNLAIFLKIGDGFYLGKYRGNEQKLYDLRGSQDQNYEVFNEMWNIIEP